VRGTRIERLVNDYFASLWRLARRWGLSPTDADDVAQRALVIAHQKLDDIAEGSEKAFLFRTALFLASKVHRARKRKPEVDLDAEEEPIDQGADPEQLLDQYRMRRRLDEVLAAMPADLRAVFVLFELENLSQPDIAAALAIPIGTVASRLRRARETFESVVQRQRFRAAHQTGAQR
jgi:RNA polymerase sigma-70 factor (ECF subfamily)